MDSDSLVSLNNYDLIHHKKREPGSFLFVCFVVNQVRISTKFLLRVIFPHVSCSYASSSTRLEYEPNFCYVSYFHTFPVRMIRRQPGWNINQMSVTCHISTRFLFVCFVVNQVGISTKFLFFFSWRYNP